MTQRRILLCLALMASAAAGLGCHHDHLSSNYGRAYASWFSAQHVNRQPANPEQAKRVIEGLDAQEAALVAKTYRRTTGKGDDSQGSQMLMVAPTRGGGEVGYVPPPSVPQQQ